MNSRLTKNHALLNNLLPKLAGYWSSLCCVFYLLNRDKRELGKYQAILIVEAWSIKDLPYDIENISNLAEKNG